MLAAEQAKVSALQEDNQLLMSGTTAEVQDQAVQPSQVPISGALPFHSDHDLRRNAERGDLVPVSHLPDSFWKIVPQPDRSATSDQRRTQPVHQSQDTRDDLR